MPMADLISQIDVSANVMMALRDKRGPLYPLLQLAELYERHQWEEVSALGHRLGFNRSVVAEMMTTATGWAEEIPGSAVR